MSTRFRSQLSIDSIQDPFISNLWEVMMPQLYISHYVPGNDNYCPIVEEITFAPLGFENSNNIRAITTYYNIPVDKQDAKEANITMYCENDMKAQYYLKAWREMIFDEENEFYYEPWQYKRDIIINMYSAADNVPVLQYLLKGCYPLLQNDIALKYSRTPDRLTITQKFNVDRVIIQNYAQNGKKGTLGTIIQSTTGIISSVQNIAKNGISSIASSLMNSKNKSNGVVDPKKQDNAYGGNY